MWGTYVEEQGAGGHRHGDGRPHRRDRGDGLVPVVRRQQLRRHRIDPLQEPGGQPPVRAGLGDEGVHHRGRPRRRGDHARHDRARRQQPAARRGQDPERRSLQRVRTGTARSPPGRCSSSRTTTGRRRSACSWGGERLYQAFRRFGFGTPTGVDIAGEEPGVVWNPDGPNASGDLTAAQNAFGQGLSVTAVQLVAGYAAIANGGTMVTPARDRRLDRRRWRLPPHRDATAGERIMRQETATTVVQLLLGAVDGGIAGQPRCPATRSPARPARREMAGPVRGSATNERPGSRSKTVTQSTRHGWIDSSFIRCLAGQQPAARDPDPHPSPVDLGPLPDGPAAGERLPQARAPDPRLSRPSRPTGSVARRVAAT